jgi:hypothetical protein
LSFSMRPEVSMARAYGDSVLARNLAEAGIQQPIREILTDADAHGLDETPALADMLTARGQGLSILSWRPMPPHSPARAESGKS